MTGSDDHSSTRPISVAELLAKNGSIGAPPVGGRRRRRRGNADAVTVAELTGEIPIIRDDDPPPSPAPSAVEERLEEADTDAVPAANGGADQTDAEAETEAETETEADAEAEAEITQVAADEDPAKTSSGDDVDDDYADAVAEYAAHLEHRDAETDPPAPRRFGFGRPSGKKSKASKKSAESAAADAEHMSPDPPDDGDDVDVLDLPTDVETLPVAEDLDAETAPDAPDSDVLPSYLRSSQEPLFGGQTVADDLARRGTRPAIEDGDLDDVEGDLDEEDTQHLEPRRMSSFVHGLWIVGQSVFAVILGAGLFVAFDQLWKWERIIALVLSVLVILGLVVAVRVVRKTEDIGSTLIAVAVGALVTLGPLALIQSG